MPRLAVVNGLRGIAILGVFHVHTYASHFYQFGATTFHLFGMPFSASSVAWSGWAGVSLFFVLSGLVLYLPFTDGRELNVREFYRRRWWRLAPPYLIVATLGFLWFSTSYTPAYVLRILFEIGTFTFFVLPPYEVPGNPPLWSIAVEVYLSLLLPVIVLAVRRFGFALPVVALTIAAPLLKAFCGEVRWFELLWRVAILAQSANEFLIGMWIAHAYRRGTLLATSRYAVPVFALAVLGLILVFGLYSTRMDPLPPGNVWRYSMWPLFDALLGIAVAAAISLPKGWVHAALTWRPLQVVGMMCFSIYLLHMPMLGLLVPWLAAFGLDPKIFYPLSLAAILGIAALTYRFIEFPSSDWRRLFLIGAARATGGAVTKLRRAD